MLAAATVLTECGKEQHLEAVADSIVQLANILERKLSSSENEGAGPRVDLPMDTFTRQALQA